MLKLFQKKPKKKQPPQLLDINGLPIEEGLQVMAHRYELGKCIIELDGLHYYYISLETQQKMSYTKMVDAITGNQKVEVCD